MGILIDTGVFIRCERGSAAVDLSQLSSFGEPSVSVITQSELKVGVYRANTEERRKRRQAFVTSILSNVVILPIDSLVADIHARIFADLSQNGKSIGPHDCWIAATALKYDLHLLTTNIREFSRVPALKILEF